MEFFSVYTNKSTPAVGHGSSFTSIFNLSMSETYSSFFSIPVFSIILFFLQEFVLLTCFICISFSFGSSLHFPLYISPRPFDCSFTLPECSPRHITESENHRLCLLSHALALGSTDKGLVVSSRHLNFKY